VYHSLDACSVSQSRDDGRGSLAELRDGGFAGRGSRLVLLRISASVAASLQID
jgi:hypothetical protein